MLGNTYSTDDCVDTQGRRAPWGQQRVRQHRVQNLQRLLPVQQQLLPWPEACAWLPRRLELEGVGAGGAGRGSCRYQGHQHGWCRGAQLAAALVETASTGLQAGL